MKTNKTNPLRFAGLLAGVTAALLGLQASAQLISSEPFAGYNTGTQLTADLPSPAVAGYTGNWTGVDWGTGWPTSIAGSLNYLGAGYASGTGAHIGVANGNFDEAHSARMYRLLDSSLAVNSSTAGTLYLSWLYQNGLESGATIYQMLDLYNGNTADASRTFTAGLTQNGGADGLQGIWIDPLFGLELRRLPPAGRVVGGQHGHLGIGWQLGE